MRHMLSTRSVFYTGPADLPKRGDALFLWASGSDAPEVFTYRDVPRMYGGIWENHNSVTPDEMLSWEDEPETGEVRGLYGLVVRRHEVSC